MTEYNPFAYVGHEGDQGWYPWKSPTEETTEVTEEIEEIVEIPKFPSRTHLTVSFDNEAVDADFWLDADYGDCWIYHDGLYTFTWYDHDNGWQQICIADRHVLQIDVEEWKE